jgi:hypothetical protein
MSFNQLLSVAVYSWLNSCSTTKNQTEDIVISHALNVYSKLSNSSRMDDTVILFADSIDIFYQIIHAANKTVKRLASMINTSPKDKLLLNEQKNKLWFTVLAKNLLKPYLASSSKLSLLQCWFCLAEDLALWVSIWNTNRRNHSDQLKMWLTVLFCNASARCCAPRTPILFNLRTSVVSVYSKCQS